MTPWRSRPYLDLSYAEGKTCVRCGRPGCEPCHYSGLYSDQLGKGGAQKSMDGAAADLCRECHRHFDLYEDGNSDSRAAEFLLLILVTLHRNLQLGLATLEATLRVREDATMTTKAVDVTSAVGTKRNTRRKASSRCVASAKTFPRPTGGFQR